MAYNQITADGKIAPGPDPKGPDPKTIRETIFQALNKDGFSFRWISKDHQPYHGTLQTGADNEIDLYIYAWRIINGGRKNLLSEKRIEISSTARDEGFNRRITATEKTLLLGLYDSPHGQPIFAAWDAPSNANRGKQKSCQVSVEALKEAIEKGIYPLKDTHDNIIYTFTPDYLGDYIDLVQPGNKLNNASNAPDTASLSKKVKEATLPHKKVRTIRSVEKVLEEIATLPQTEKEAVTKQRVGQGLFKELLLDKYGCKCALCNICTRSMLTASHIKEWSESEKSEKLDVENGLLLCAHHDALFDKHLISFDDNGKVIVSPTLTVQEKAALQIDAISDISVSDEMRSYLTVHRSKLKR